MDILFVFHCPLSLNLYTLQYSTSIVNIGFTHKFAENTFCIQRVVGIGLGWIQCISPEIMKMRRAASGAVSRMGNSQCCGRDV